MPLKGR